MFEVLARDFIRIIKQYGIRAKLERRGLRVGLRAIFSIDNLNDFQFGELVSVGHGSVVVVTNEMVADEGYRSTLTVGNEVYINEYCNIRASGGQISIGNKVLLAQFVTIIGSNHSYEKKNSIMDQKWDSRKVEVFIGNDVWIGAHTTILPGSRIMDGAIVGANSLINGIIPAYEIWAGNPARKVGARK